MRGMSRVGNTNHQITAQGRPNWDKVFKELQAQKKGKITIFYCGSPQLGKILKLKCDEFGFDYRKENF